VNIVRTVDVYKSEDTFKQC